MKYEQVFDGDIVQPVRKGYRMRCCDCDLIHVIDFYLVPVGRGHKIQFRARRDQRATTLARKRSKKKSVHLMHRSVKR